MMPDVRTAAIPANSLASPQDSRATSRPTVRKHTEAWDRTATARVAPETADTPAALPSLPHRSAMEIAMSESRRAEYLQKLKDVRWQQMRLKVLERDAWRCRQCQAAEGVSLHVHHSYYRAGADPWDYPQDSLLTLCEACHEVESLAWRQVNDKLISTVRRILPLNDDVDLLCDTLGGEPYSAPRNLTREEWKQLHSLLFEFIDPLFKRND